MAPVVASKAKIRLRTRSSPVLAKVLAGLTEVNVPAAMILLPTWVIALTEPFMTCGVTSAGLAETTRLPWSALTAAEGSVAAVSTAKEVTSRVAPCRARIRIPDSSAPEEVVAHRPARSSPETVTHHARVLTQLRPTSPKSGSED